MEKIFLKRDPMARLKKKESTIPFGSRLAKIRKMKGLTQKEFGELISASQRMVAHYEKGTQPPPSDKLHLIAKALNVTADELLGIKDIKDNGKPLSRKVLKTVKLLANLSKSDQKAVLHYINALASKNGLK